MKQTNPSTPLRMLGSRNTWTRDGFCEDEWDNGYEFKGKNIKCAPLHVFSEINKINFRKGISNLFENVQLKDWKNYMVWNHFFS